MKKILLFSLILVTTIATSYGTSDMPSYLSQKNKKKILSLKGPSKEYPYCQTLVMYNSPYNKTTKGSFYYLIFTEGKLYDSPGNYSLFFPTVTHFTEAQSHNTYFNRKVIIDEKGFYVLGVHEGSRYGNVKELGLDELVSSADYTQYWKVNKDKTEVCKDCEFRYMCIDSRIPLKNTATGLFYFKSECSYSPYTCKWDIKKIQIKEL